VRLPICRPQAPRTANRSVTASCPLRLRRTPTPPLPRDTPDRRHRHWPPFGVQTSLSTLGAFLEVARAKTEEVNHGHRDSAALLQMLVEAPPTVRPIAYCNVAGCPSMRACPNCGVIIEYESACKHFNCALCGHEFCFICLRDRAHHPNGEWSYSFGCQIAPVQTELPQLPDAS
jgi:hypothetical protein